MAEDKIAALKARIEKASKANAPAQIKLASNNSKAFNVAIELLAGTIVGVIIGLFLDKIFASKPLFLIICIVLGNLASLRIIWKMVNKKDRDA